MRKNSITLYMLILSPLGLLAQSYVAPPPLLPNPAYNSVNVQPVNPVYASETNTSNLGNTQQNQSSKTHIVKKGETLYRISQLYNVGIEDIKTWNYLSSDLISTGMNLSIGAPAPYTSNAVPAQYNQLSPRSPGWLSGIQNHTFLAGESLASIAQYYGLTEERLRFMNNLGPQDLVQPGSLLNVNPCISAAYQGDNPASYEQPSTGNTTTVGNQNYSSPVPSFFPPQDRFANRNNYNNTNLPNDYNTYGNPGYGNPTYNNPAYGNPGTSNPSGNYSYRQEDQYDPNLNNTNAVPNSYDFAARGNATTNPAGSNSSLIIENGRRAHVVKTDDTLETIADFYQLLPERLRTLNNMGAYDIVWPNQKIFLE